MKRSLLIAAAAATAVALLTGCSASTSEEGASPKPSATSETNTPNQPKPEPPEGSDPKLVAFTDILVASCDKVTADGGIAQSDVVKMITVPEAKAIDKVADVAIVSDSQGKVVANYIIGPTPRTGKPMPFVCSISGAAFSDLMASGKSARFTEADGVWTWTEKEMRATLNIKGGMIDSFTQTATQDGKEIATDFTVTYGLTDADLKAFADAVKNAETPEKTK